MSPHNHNSGHSNIGAMHQFVTTSTNSKLHTSTSLPSLANHDNNNSDDSDYDHDLHHWTPSDQLSFTNVICHLFVQRTDIIVYINARVIL
jgi:hypothetical protein